MALASWYENSPLGKIYLTSDGNALTGLFFDSHQRFWSPQEDDIISDLPVFKATRHWLDAYFAGKNPGSTPPLSLEGLSPFRKAVCEEMLRIPFGKLSTYGTLAQNLALCLGRTTSARAVGGAVGHNPIGIIIPCHRVIGAQGNLTGYGAGIERKIALLELEGIDTSTFSLPKNAW